MDISQNEIIALWTLGGACVGYLIYHLFEAPMVKQTAKDRGFSEGFEFRGEFDKAQKKMMDATASLLNARIKNMNKRFEGLTSPQSKMEMGG